MGCTDRRGYFKNYRLTRRAKFVHYALKKEQIRHKNRIDKLLGRCPVVDCEVCLTYWSK